MNNELVKIENGKAVTTSKIIAKEFGKEHKHVLESVDNIFKTLEKDRLKIRSMFKTFEKDWSKIGPMFKESTYKDDYGRLLRCIDVDWDGFMLLAMGFTGAKALKAKLAFIEAFSYLES